MKLSKIYAMNICPVNREWLHSFLVEPCLQGTELINQAWTGRHFNPLNQSRLSLTDRAICFIKGTVLLIPLVNTIIWLAWQTFGNPERLFDPYTPSSKTFIATLPEIEEPEGQPAETFRYNETGKNNTKLTTEWSVYRGDKETKAFQKCKEYHSHSTYTPDGTLQSYHYQGRNEEVEAQLIDPRHIKVRCKKEGNEVIKTLKLEKENIPWIQQPTLGFKNFILDKNRKTMTFYGLMVENPIPLFGDAPPFLLEATATKGEETLPEFGRQIKVEVVAKRRLYSLSKGVLWFDPPDGPSPGMLRKFVDPGLLTQKQGIFAKE